MWFEGLATLATALFTGAAIYVSLVEHPARLSCGSAVALTQWRPSYKRGTAMQAPLAVAGAVLGIAAWLTGSSAVWLIAALVIGAVVPFTLLVIFPTNHRLEDEGLDGTSDLALGLLSKWGALHAVRALLGLLALVMMIFAR
ncbi:DUF1772 domain-containing protein [Rhodospirillaceae bacterium SYSU D60014]|uniref:DUF1772 domain-containing protein n=1 Tax=Virgifigura deserti TaxID=2268457 RepID=UPI000E6657C6